ncbi:[protein-PII] uridylyltransferase [Ferrovibrio sp.]|uniref:[protein-PII] uridylyltransferase n=1 Tax=Ferrovibrio sp. TaxID=1917215 RepID=UPI003D2815B2
MLNAIPDRRAIIDRKSLLLQLEALPAEGKNGATEQRAQALVLLKAALNHGREAIRARFVAGATALVTRRAQAFLIDQIIRLTFDFTTQRVYRLPNPTAAEKLSIVAVGGYGRGEMAPFSDVDLLFLFPYKQTPWGEQVVEYMLYLFWDMGLKVGHSTRSVEECLRLSMGDLTIRTALLEQRWIWGEQDLAQSLWRRFQTEVMAKTGPDFIEKKLGERDDRHQRMGDSRYLVEPNIKEGKGGLRDLHTLLWIAKYVYGVADLDGLIERGLLSAEEYRRYTQANEFLWTVRCHLHYLAGRPEERLTFDLQTEIAKAMGYADRPGRKDVERFMKRYYLAAKEVGDLTRIFAAALEERHKKKKPLAVLKSKIRRPKAMDGFVNEGGRLNLQDEKLFIAQPVKMLRLFHLAQEHGLDIHPDALRLVRQNLKLIGAALRNDAEANRLFIEMLTSKNDPETTLRRLNEAGILGRFVPDFGRVVAQMQHDMYHVYTVDEHTIRAIGLLSRIENGALAEEHPLAVQVIHQIVSRRVLYVALLLHDIAKGRGGDHSILGEKVGLKLGPRFGLSPAETETVAWLVRWHLAMSATAFKRDIADPKTVVDFANLIQSPERLRLLLVLTVADIRAVGPNVWNGWKGQLLRELYYRAEEFLSGGFSTRGREQRITETKQTVRARLPDWPVKEQDELLKRHYENYWFSNDAETILRHARLMRVADKEKRTLTLETRVDGFRDVTELTLYAPDHPGLFARVAGAIAATGGNIVDAKIFTTTDGMALDTFFVQDTEGKAFDRPDKLARLSTAIQRTLAGDLRPRLVLGGDKPGLPSRTRVFKVAPVVLIDNNASNRHTVVEVNGRDRPGFLYEVTRGLYDLNLSIRSAHIATYGERAVDVFYVQDLTGQKIHDEARLRQIERHLLKLLTQVEEKAAPTKAIAGTKAAPKPAARKDAA